MARGVQQTERDTAVLRWIGEQFAIREDHLQILAARYTPPEDKEKLNDPYRLTVSAVRESLYRRWQHADWSERRKILHGQPMWVWLSRKGLATFAPEYPYREPKVTRLNHIYHVNTVRLYYEAQLGNQAVWVNERTVATRRKKSGAKHRVDGEVHMQGQVFAVEVELTTKSQTRLDSILAELAQDYDGIYYLAASACYQAVADAIARLPSPRQPAFRLNALEQIVARVEQGDFPKRR